MRTLIRRSLVSGGCVSSLVKLLVRFSTADPIERVHPLQSGILRLKHPSERRPELPAEPAWIFWPRFAWETLKRNASLIGVIVRLTAMAMVSVDSAKSRSYTDRALTPVRDDEDEETLDLLTKTAGAREAVAHQKKVA